MCTTGWSLTIQETSKGPKAKQGEMNNDAGEWGREAAESLPQRTEDRDSNISSDTKVPGSAFRNSQTVEISQVFMGQVTG